MRHLLLGRIGLCLECRRPCPLLRRCGLGCAPAQALERWQETVNPTDAIAGVISVTSAVLDLPRGVLEKFSALDRARVRALAASVPAIPVARSQNKTHAQVVGGSAHEIKKKSGSNASKNTKPEERLISLSSKTSPVQAEVAKENEAVRLATTASGRMTKSYRK